MSQSYRFFESDRHFTGAHEDVDRTEEGSQVINTVFAVDTVAAYGLSERLSLSLAVPYLLAERSSPIRNEESEVIDRSRVRARGLGDVALTLRGWVRDPLTRPRANLEIGLGLKLPTGSCSVQDTRKRRDAQSGTIVQEVATVDQSIQPGDCGWGIPLTLAGNVRIGAGVSAYLDGTYLFNPRETNGVLTYRRRASEAVMSVADQYLLRIGGSYQVPWVNGLGASLGGRIEGVPVRDLLGESGGFRRPGFTLSVDPGLSYKTGDWSFFGSVPVAVHRERQRSVTDIEDATHGDAAFADYQVTIGFLRVFR